MKMIVTALATATTIILAGLTSAQNLEYVNSTVFSGNIRSLSINGNYAYCTSARNLHIISVEDQANPVPVGGFTAAHEYITDVFVAANYAYLTWRDRDAGQAGLEIVDIANPARPILAGSYTPLNEPMDIFVVDGCALVADGDLQVIDISEPSDPEFVNTYATDGHTIDVFVLDEYAYVPYARFVDIVDISAPANPLTIATVAAPFDVIDVFVSGNYAYACWGRVDGFNFWYGLEIWDIADRASPLSVGSFTALGMASGLFVSQGNAYVNWWEGGWGGIEIIDVSDPANPTMVAEHADEIPYYVLVVSGNIVYMANERFVIADFSDPLQPDIIGSYTCPQFTGGVFVDDDYAYAIAMSPALQTVDASDPYMPGSVGALPGYALDISVVDDYAYLAAGIFGLRIVDVSVPAEPVLGGEYITENPAYDVFVCDHYAFVLCRPQQSSDLCIIDVSEPSYPTLISTYDGDIFFTDIFVVGDHAYLAHSSEGLHIIDVSDPSDPIPCGDYDTDYEANGVFVDANYAYLAVDHSGLLILDITDPCNPVLSGCCHMPGTANRVFVSGEYAYVTDTDIEVVDISDPSNPFITACYNTPGWACDIFVEEEYVFISDGHSLLILRFNPETGMIEEANMPSRFVLKQSYPNPFNSSTTIEYGLPQEAEVTVEIYDILGRRVEALFEGSQSAGSHSVTWDAETVPSGVYFYRIEAGEYSQVRRCLLLK